MKKKVHLMIKHGAFGRFHVEEVDVPIWHYCMLALSIGFMAGVLFAHYYTP